MKKPKIIRDKLEDKIINDICKLFETEEEKENRRKKKQNKKIIKDKIIRDIRTLFEQEKEEDYYEPKCESNLWNNIHIEYEKNSDENRSLPLDVYLNEIKSYLRNITINPQNSNTWKIQLTFAINFIFSKDSKEERSDNIKLTFYSEGNDVIEKLLKSLCSKYQDDMKHK